MAKRVSVHDRFKSLRSSRTRDGITSRFEAFQGVTKARVNEVLSKLSLDSTDLVDCAFALLDDETESFRGFTFSQGASTAQLGAHIAFLQRDSDIKLDREGRDYWISPLRQIGAIEAVTLSDGVFLAGHIKAKSPNSSYRLNKEFADILKAPDSDWESHLASWISEDRRRLRLEMQAKAAEEARKTVETGHAQLISASISIYAKHFLPGFQVLLVDDSDGQRISDEEALNLRSAGIELRPDDAFPDVLLWDPAGDMLWCIEAVTSDGEVDDYKKSQMERLATRHEKTGIGFTTTYETWKAAASRQDANRNLAIDSYVWIQSDPTRQFHVSTFLSSPLVTGDSIRSEE